MASAEFPTPWRVRRSRLGVDEWAVADAKDVLVARLIGYQPLATQKRVLCRIVAAVNATEALEVPAFQAEVARLREHVEAALEALRDDNDEPGAQAILRTALAPRSAE